MLRVFNKPAECIFKYVDSDEDPALSSEVNRIAANSSSVADLTEQLKQFFHEENSLTKSVHKELLLMTLHYANFETLAHEYFFRYFPDESESNDIP
jgi:hypothetical protein